MDEKMRNKFKEMLMQELNTPVGMAVVLSMVGMVENDERFEQLADLYEGIEEYKNYATEKEAKKVVDHFDNWDGSRGAKWGNIDIMTEEVRKAGGMIEVKGFYNKWMMYILINNIYSDYGGVISKLVDNSGVPKVCYMMAIAKLEDRDRKMSMRKYFCLE
jgi:hypothetical protein